MKHTHIPVLLEETLDLLGLKDGDVVVDATLGLGGHANSILERIKPSGKLIGIDQDEQALNIARANLQPHTSEVVLVNGNFSDINYGDVRHFITAQAAYNLTKHIDISLSGRYIKDDIDPDQTIISLGVGFRY